MDISSKDLHVAILSSPGMGHLIPVLVLANRLAASHKIKVTVLLVTTGVAQPESNLLKLPLDQSLVELIELPPVDISHLVGPSTQVVTQLCIMRPCLYFTPPSPPWTAALTPSLSTTSGRKRFRSRQSSTWRNMFMFLAPLSR
ncbi:hypothetical protein RD792_016958 [Penstemon davidsonii]|uniref:Uncharacterized protein n=1 Tax=Penstemon davidsonii TaxID=160366 RepID=A0ABR0CLJ1_9LAMI|nr:hypothetical protein RD792_016958 [Penstemon davidsonii]